MKAEVGVFVTILVFFGIVGTTYGIVTDWQEHVGSVGLLLSGGLGAMVAFYLWKTARSLPARPDDDPDGEISQIAGAYGSFAPYSWWPLWLALSGALVFLGMAVQFWILLVGLIMGVWAVVGWTMEYFIGENAH